MHAITTYMSTFKSILIPTLTLAAGLAAGYWWAESKGSGGRGQKPGPDSSRYVCNSSTIVPEKDLLSVDTAFNMIARYGKRLPPDSTHTRSIWFSTERMHALLCILKRDSLSGVRFYLGEYAENYPVPHQEGTIGHDPIKPYWGHTTLVLVTTREERKKHLDHVQVHANGVPHKGMIFTGPHDDDEPENNGELCPP
ncbi:hypothetical protein, partial [uncultured Chitinophaga sp.]|uniref:hypothetical protein n=1 Tax=uncultured Chitinophaga sp. TaxID=339340 RepID=UPI00261F9F41